MAVVLIVVGGIGYYFYKTSQEQKEQIVDETADWETYINDKLGFSIKVPREMMHTDGFCEWIDAESSYRPKAAPVPVKIFEDTYNNIVYISSEYFYELAGETREEGVSYFSECNKVINSLKFLEEGSYPQQLSWEIVVREVTNDDELEKFIKEHYGSGCGLGEKVPTAQEGVYDIRIDTGGAKDIEEAFEMGCLVNYAHVLKYHPQKNKVISWKLGQAASFFRVSGFPYNPYDDEMVESFRFLE